VTVQVPAEAVTQTGVITLTFTPAGSVSVPPAMSFAGLAFDLSAFQGNIPLPGLTFCPPLIITVQYTDEDVAGLDEEELEIRYWDGSTWSSEGITVIERRPEVNEIEFSLSHLSPFALILEGYIIYMPVVVK
jgi:hypothetical protein